MAEVAAPSAPAGSETATPKKGSAGGAKKTKTAGVKASHPPTAVMVNNAIKNLKERGGSSLQAIKKYISSTYKVDAEKLSFFIKRYIKASVTSGDLVQTKGKGASGSFKLSGKKQAAVGKKPAASGKKPASESVEKKVKKTAAKTTKAKKSDESVAKKPVGRKAAKPKKTAAAAAAKKTVAAKPKASPKAKKTAKAPTKKPKSPKPKTTKMKTATKAGKKASPKKK